MAGEATAAGASFLPWGSAIGAAVDVVSAAVGGPPPSSTAIGGTATGGGITVNYNKGALDWDNPVHVALAVAAVISALWLLKKKK